MNQGDQSITPPIFAQDTLPKLTRKQEAFVKHILAHPKDSYTEAAAQAYNTNNRGTAQTIATENLSKPVIKMALGIANNRVEEVLTGVVDEWGSSENVRERALAVNTAQYIHDKIHGKAKQITEVTSNLTMITMDLTGGALGQPPQEILDLVAE